MWSNVRQFACSGQGLSRARPWKRFSVFLDDRHDVQGEENLVNVEKALDDVKVFRI